MSVSAPTPQGGEPPRPAARDHGFHPVRVSRVVTETPDAVSVALDVPSELREAFAYRAGQFVTFRVEIDGEHYLRSYSMSSSPDVDGEMAVTVKRVPGGAVSGWVTTALSAGDVLDSTCPAGVFTLGSGSGTGDIVAFAGGSGITPVFSLLKSALATTSRRVRLFYANRDRDSVIFQAALDELTGRHPDRLEVVHHLDSEQGVVAVDEVGPYAADPAGDYFICGPAPFMDLVEETLLGRGVDRERIHIERFSPLTPTELPPEAPVEDSGAATQVTITLDNKTATAVHRPGTTILQTARSMGMTPPFSCEAGDCATCMAKLLEGAADMFVNNALYDDEVADGWVLTCQAVPTTPTIRVVYGYEEGQS